MEQMDYDVFISYSRHDYMDDNENIIPNNEVSKIMEALTDAGITYWTDKRGFILGISSRKNYLKSLRQLRYLCISQLQKPINP